MAIITIDVPELKKAIINITLKEHCKANALPFLYQNSARKKLMYIDVSHTHQIYEKILCNQYNHKHNNLNNDCKAS